MDREIQKVNQDRDVDNAAADTQQTRNKPGKEAQSYPEDGIEREGMRGTIRLDKIPGKPVFGQAFLFPVAHYFGVRI